MHLPNRGWNNWYRSSRDSWALKALAAPTAWASPFPIGTALNRSGGGVNTRNTGWPSRAARASGTRVITCASAASKAKSASSAQHEPPSPPKRGRGGSNSRLRRLRQYLLQMSLRNICYFLVQRPAMRVHRHHGGEVHDLHDPNGFRASELLEVNIVDLLHALGVNLRRATDGVQIYTAEFLTRF